MLSITRELANRMLGTDSFAQVMDDCKLCVYEGTTPSNPDPSLPAAEAGLGTAVLLCTYSDNGTGSGLTWDATPTANIIEKDPTQAWKGTPVASGTATFFRIMLLSDDGSAATDRPRIQGNVGPGLEMNVGSTAFVSGVERTIYSMRVAMVA